MEEASRVSSSNSRPRTESGNRDMDGVHTDTNSMEGSRRVHSADHKNRVANTLDSDIIDLVTTNQTPRNAAVIPEKVKKVKQAYGETVSNKGASKKTEQTSKSFGRNSMDAPPSVDLMAKFALEKEQQAKAKYKQEVQQQVYQEEMYDQEFYEYDDNTGINTNGFHESCIYSRTYSLIGGYGWSQSAQQNDVVKGRNKKIGTKGSKSAGPSKKKNGSKKAPLIEENPLIAASGYGNPYFPMNMPMAMPQGLSGGNSIISARYP